MLDIMVFFIGALLIAALSRRCLSDPRSHGFMRFLSFEALWALIVMNARPWFREPFSLHQIVSWILLTASAAVALSAFLTFRARGESQPVATSSTLFKFENTSQLIRTGLYAHIRHPMYASLVLLGWGAALKSFSVWSLVLAAAATALLVMTARTEELENLERFGEPYDEYMNSTKMFIPGLF